MTWNKALSSNLRPMLRIFVKNSKTNKCLQYMHNHLKPAYSQLAINFNKNEKTATHYGTSNAFPIIIPSCQLEKWKANQTLALKNNDTKLMNNPIDLGIIIQMIGESETSNEFIFDYGNLLSRTSDKEYHKLQGIPITFQTHNIYQECPIIKNQKETTLLKDGRSNMPNCNLDIAFFIKTYYGSDTTKKLFIKIESVDEEELLVDETWDNIVEWAARKG